MEGTCLWKLSTTFNNLAELSHNPEHVKDTSIPCHCHLHHAQFLQDVDTVSKAPEHAWMFLTTQGRADPQHQMIGTNKKFLNRWEMPSIVVRTCHLNGPEDHILQRAKTSRSPKTWIERPAEVGISPNTGETKAADRPSWRRAIHFGCSIFDERRKAEDEVIKKRQCWTGQLQPKPSPALLCDQ